MDFDFMNLPFETEKTMSVHAVSNEYLEFFDEPKLKLYRYGEKSRPYLHNWFALGCDWFPESHYLVFDHRVAIELNGSELPFKSKDRLIALASLITNQNATVVDFIKHVVATKQLKVQKVRLKKV